jgi:hypothetical protein
MDPWDAAVLADLLAHPHHHDPPPVEALARRWVWNDLQDQQLQAVQADWETALARVLANWRSIAADQRMQLLDQVLDAVEASDLQALATMAVNVDDATDELAQAMRALAEQAAQRMADEANSQGVDITPVAGNLNGLDQVAAATATLLGTGLALSAGREALRIRGGQRTPAETTRGVQDHLEALSDVTLTDLAGGALSRAQNQGRVETLRAALEDGDGPEPAYYANETLDRNTCKPCEHVDGRWLGNDLDQVDRIYPGGGYVDCRGRERCRGTVVAVFRPLDS